MNMRTKMKIAICAAVVVCAASASFAKDQSAERNGAKARQAFGQAEIVRNPTRKPISGAEWWQNHGIADEMGYAYP